MKKIIFALILGLILSSSVQSAAEDSGKKERAADKWTEAQKVSYILGSQIGQISKANDVKIDMALIIRGLNDVVDGVEPAIAPREVKSVMAEFKRKAQKKQQSAMKDLEGRNLKKGEAFLKENKDKAGVHVTASGLQYKVIKKGDGPMPKAADRVRVHYRGRLIDGKEFDSSYRRKRPAEFGLTQVIKGWTEGLQLMKVGSKYEFYIPSKLAYGKKAPPSIGPGQTLIFEVELLGIVK
ncbi:MAG: FKBP-type peptidyl-prolyl cis-trans isomerase [Thermodesulfobacteriota bacterium]